MSSDSRHLTLDEGLTGRLLRHKVTPTAQRMDLARILFRRAAHFSAEQLHEAAVAEGCSVSKATVYNTLALFVSRGLVREVLVDSTRVVYDSNTEPHHHVYHVDTGELRDIHADEVSVSGVPELPSGMEVEGVDVVFRVRRSE